MRIKKSNFVPIFYKGERIRIRKSDILFIQTESYFCRSRNEDVLPGSGNYTRITTAQGKTYLVAMMIADWMKYLVNDYFERTHQSIIVNMEYAHKLSFTDGTQLELENGLRLPVSHRRKKAIMAAF